MSFSLAYSIFLFFYWDPPREAFVIPILNHPVAWYGIFFAFGFLVAYLVFRRLLAYRLQKVSSKPLEIATRLTDRLSFYTVIGVVIGARLIEVIFYEWPYYREHPWNIIKVWEGGLASHGGILGAIAAILLFYWRIRKEYPSLKLLSLIDMAVIPSAFAGAMIRFGNFMNQEILGEPSNLPWATLFGHPMEMVSFVPRHPVQLYEACFYLLLFIGLLLLWKFKKDLVYEGFFTGLFFLTLFIFRFCIEWLKLPQSKTIDETFLSMGQLLSIPFIIFGLLLFLFSFKKKLIKY